MAVYVIGSSLMTSDQTPHRAPSVGQEGWAVSYLPGRTPTRTQAAAPQIAEAVPPLLESVGGLATKVGLTLLEALGMAIHQRPWGDQPPARRRTYGEVVACS